ncbi:uncharacterized protein CANTADRAFT_88608 [Suhomyces tanzawaensis NRRL Y-17324]|uniref:RRM domain-containing protein n=1 Tax=Suhomyces tanzawaensis NRRL Y-17324 TaxID=984487 RepID=A0A1E4SMD2_9ASCO|nr:uncharacterized protein CANTADRAFT_88608 [Suhomyces tanzawaensis NRRL Y-17324]ODV80686.1 hypothetical protein CANTADRAFT_88608 [Suhomyces tanzawaensis NRRL Y-17324]
MPPGKYSSAALQPPPTPLDLNYLHSMIPSNLLVNSPYFQQTPSSGVFPGRAPSVDSDSEESVASTASNSFSHPHHVHHHPHHHPGYTGYGFGLQPPMSPMPSSPYLTHLNNTSSSNTSSVSNHNLDQLNLSRTVILKHLADDLSLNELLNNVDLGPIEYCKMFSKPTPKHILDQDPNATPNMKLCYISFINSKISILFHLKYFKNSANLNSLKAALKNSTHLKILLNDTSANPAADPSYTNNSKHQDFIKLKTLNYILDFNATRCLMIKFTIKDIPVSELDVDSASAIKSFVLTQCQKFGDVEDFKITLESKKPDPETTASESDKRVTGKVLVHFTSIDAAIKTYESYLRRIQHDKQRTLDAQDPNGAKKKTKAKKDEKNVNVLYDINFFNVAFHKDRCDKTILNKQTKPHKKTQKFSDIPEENDPTFFQNSEVPGTQSELEIEIDSEDPLAISVDADDISKVSSSSILGADSPSLSSSTPSPVSEHSNAHHNQFAGQRRDSHPNFIPPSPMLMQNGYGNTRHRMHLFHDVQQVHGHPYMLPGPNMVHGHPMNSATPNYPLNPDPYNVDNRTIYLGNLHQNTSIEEIANNVRAGGLVENINYHPEKKVCFITFVDPQIALKFYLNHQVLHQLIIHGHDITVSWAKNHSGPINRDIALAVTAGASRNVYIGIKLVKDENGNPINSNGGNKSSLRLPNESTLRKDFSLFGEMEQINFYHNKDCGFLNFLNIMDAIKLVETFELDATGAKTRLSKIFSTSPRKEFIEGDLNAFVDQFYKKYQPFKISFAKDRCGNPPKFSFKKKASNFQGSTYQQYQHLLHGSVNKRGKNKLRNSRLEEYDEATRMQEHDSFMEDTINQEAAMVFGIISNSEVKPGSETESKESEVVVEDATETKETEDAKLKTADAAITNNKIEVAGQVVDADADDEDDLDDDEDDDDEVSIIIGSDDTLSNAPKENLSKDKKSGRNKKSHSRLNGYDKVYHSNFNSSESSIRRSSRNSSNISLNSSYSKYSQPPPPTQQPYKFASSPYVQQQQVYYMPSPGGHPNARPYGGYGYSVPNNGYFPQQYYVPHPHSHPHHQPRQHYGHPQSKTQFSTSGSQVMAQYLAKSQHDNMIYAASVMSNDIGADDDIDLSEFHSIPNEQPQKPRTRKVRK